MEQVLDGSFGALEQRGDVGDGTVLDVEQRERVRLPRRQLAQLAPELFGLRVLLGVVDAPVAQPHHRLGLGRQLATA